MPFRNDTEEGRAKAKESRRRHYYANPAPYKARAKRKRDELREFIRQYKESHPCTDCGIQYPFYVMQFDHLRDKTMHVGVMVNLGNLNKIKDEIAKCEVVCANCHFERTFQRAAEERFSESFQTT